MNAYPHSKQRHLLVRIAGIFKNALYPTKCLACGSFFHSDVDQNSGFAEKELRDGNFPFLEKAMAPFLCEICVQDFVAVESPMCSQCGIRFKSREGQDHVCGACIAAPKRFDMARALGVYERTLLTVIHRMKYGGKVQAARPLGMLLFFVLLRYWEKRRLDLIIPVPLHAKKMRLRGFNQSLLLVRGWASIAARLNVALPYTEVDRQLLIRARWTEPQTGLGRKQRRANIRNAFSVSDSSKIAGRRILLVDDVYTTGATVNECAKVLLQAGAKRVDVLTLAQAL